MKNFKTITLGTVFALGFTAQAAMAAEQRIYQHTYEPRLDTNKSAAMESFLKYEDREPCQNYRQPPSGYYYDGCHLVRREIVVMKEAPAPAEAVAQIKPAAGNVLADYQVNFAFDDASLEPSVDPLLDQVAYEIKTFKPSEVVVSGYTDAAGTDDYNDWLSQRRAENLSRALTERGIENRIIERKAYGENNLEVQTPDGVALRENRRATIQFLK